MQVTKTDSGKIVARNFLGKLETEELSPIQEIMSFDEEKFENDINRFYQSKIKALAKSLAYIIDKHKLTATKQVIKETNPFLYLYSTNEKEILVLKNKHLLIKFQIAGEQKWKCFDKQAFVEALDYFKEMFKLEDPDVEMVKKSLWYFMEQNSKGHPVFHEFQDIHSLWANVVMFAEELSSYNQRMFKIGSKRKCIKKVTEENVDFKIAAPAIYSNTCTFDEKPKMQVQIEINETGQRKNLEFKETEIAKIIDLVNEEIDEMKNQNIDRYCGVLKKATDGETTLRNHYETLNLVSGDMKKDSIEYITLEEKKIKLIGYFNLDEISRSGISKDDVETFIKELIYNPSLRNKSGVYQIIEGVEFNIGL